MRQRQVVDESLTPDGESLTLSVEHGDYVVRVRGEVLMSSRQRGSEEAMARLAIAGSGADLRVLVGGLGMGFSLRAVLDRLGSNGEVCVVELLADVLRWNRGPLASLADSPLDDRRVAVEVTDLLDHLATVSGAFDAIVLDIDNGPEAFTIASNNRLYLPEGLALLYGALREGGVIVLWSAFRSTSFERHLRRAGFDARSVTTRARPEVNKGARHTLFVATRPSSG